MLGGSGRRCVAVHGVVAHKPPRAAGSVPGSPTQTPDTADTGQTCFGENQQPQRSADLISSGGPLPDKWRLHPMVEAPPHGGAPAQHPLPAMVFSGALG